MSRAKPTKTPPRRTSISTPPREFMEAAVRVRAFLDGGPIPNFIGDAVTDAVAEASRRTGAPEPEVHPELGYDLDELAYLFEIAWMIDLRAPGSTITPTQALAAQLSAVLTHPETPAPLYEAIANHLSAWSSDYLAAFCDTAPYIESCLLYHQREQREQTEGGCDQ